MTVPKAERCPKCNSTAKTDIYDGVVTRTLTCRNCGHVWKLKWGYAKRGKNLRQAMKWK